MFSSVCVLCSTPSHSSASGSALPAVWHRVFANGECPSPPLPAHPSRPGLDLPAPRRRRAVLGSAGKGGPLSLRELLFLSWEQRGLLGSQCPTGGLHGQGRARKSRLPRSTRLCSQPGEGAWESCGAQQPLFPNAALPDDLRSPIRIEREELRNLHFFPPEYGRECGVCLPGRGRRGSPEGRGAGPVRGAGAVRLRQHRLRQGVCHQSCGP